jgi:hypothetical protein
MVFLYCNVRQWLYSNHTKGRTKMQNLEPHQAYCLANAAYFTAVRGRRPATRTRIEFPTLEAAQEYATGFGDGCTMIYAVTRREQYDHLFNI